MRLPAVAVGVGALLGCWVSAGSAAAFEREWHVGAAAGVSDGTGLSLSPALGAYAAYGLSDVFDVRLEATARGYQLGSGDNPSALNVAAGLAYKLDVLRWIPWAAVYVGYTAFLEQPGPALTFQQHDAALGLGLGLDYAFSRQLGLGVTLRFDDALSSTDDESFDGLLRAEYRWGW